MSELDIIWMSNLQNHINATIILKVNIAKNKNQMLVANYCQWKGNPPHCNFNSWLDTDCEMGFKEMLFLWKKSCRSRIKCRDVNIDRLLNCKPTCFRRGQRPTLLDLVLSNFPEWINNLTREHQCVSFTMRIKEVKTNVQFYKIRGRRYLTAERILPLIKENAKLNNFFKMTDADLIADTFTKEFKAIINFMAPSRRIHKNKRNKQKLSKETIDAIN